MSGINLRKPLLSALMLAGALGYASAGMTQSTDDASATSAQPPASAGAPSYPAGIEVDAIVPRQSDTSDAAFNKLDIDGKGYVTEDDAAALPGFDFRSADTDHDGKLSPEEFRDAWMNYSGESAGSNPNASSGSTETSMGTAQ
jgi:hypothetical protein